MVASWRLVIDGELEKADEARALAASVGEAEHFDLEMAPAMLVWNALSEAADGGHHRKRRPHSLRMKLTADCASTPVGTALNPEDRQMTAHTDLDDRDPAICRRRGSYAAARNRYAPPSKGVGRRQGSQKPAGAKKARRPARRVA